MKYAALFLICALCLAPAANAEVTVKEQVLQKGLFVNPDCKNTLSSPGYDECRCDADIRYPQISGLSSSAAQAALNSNFKQTAEKAHCEGKEVPPEKIDKGKEGSSASHHYEVTFQSPAVLGLKFTDWAFTGGAHGNGSIEGVIIDLAKGKILSPGDLIAPKDMTAVNKAIYDTLSAKPEGEIFHDQIEQRKGAFISDEGCQGCTLILMPDGMKVVFQTYEVASFAEGNMEVPIPEKYISYPGIVAALSQPKAPVPMPEKK